jgi:hypothetical protein
MKALLMAVLALALVGCTAAPHSETAGARRSTAAKVAARGTKPVAPKKTRAVAKAQHVRTAAPSPAARSKKSDPATERAKSAIAALLEDPSSAQFYKLQRAQKKLLHRDVDTICGYVRAKGASGRSAGGMPFLYIVGHDREDEAYLVSGTSHVSETVHRALCR